MGRSFFSFFTKRRAKSAESLRKKTKSTESLDTVVTNLKTCQSLMELSRVTPADPLAEGATARPLSRSNSLDRRKRRTARPRDIEPSSKLQPQTRRTARSAGHLNHHPGGKETVDQYCSHHKAAAADSGYHGSDGHLHCHNRENGLHNGYQIKDVKMLAKATKVIQDHMKDMTEKTKTSCPSCIGKQQKENVLFNHHTHTHEPHHYIKDSITGTTYVRGRLLGKGGFAKCYELTDIHSGKVYAGKVISKNRIAKPHQRDKIAKEVELHKHLRQRHVVGFHSYFEDLDNVYIVLENCCRKSLVHVLKSRKTLTEPEVRYYLRHLIDGCKYIHNQKIIHRDLKLGNMLLNEHMQVKIADFGLATRVSYEGEKKMTVCGTPNYIAPEVLQKKGHSYEADIWAVGCVMYAMLVGRPPFETTTLKETYMRITNNKFSVPSHISPQAKNLITKLLHADPSKRPTLDRILAHDFFSSGYIPKTLNSACCVTAPKFSSSTTQRPKSYAAPVSATEAMNKITSSIASLKTSKRPTSPIPSIASSTNTQIYPKDDTLIPQGVTPKAEPSRRRRPSSSEIKALPFGSAVRLYQMLTTCIEQMPADSNPSPVHQIKPLWVTKWVDYSNKYGFGFQLSDKSVGVLFNDTTRMLLTPDGRTIQYNDLSNKVYTFTNETCPTDYQKKATLLLYFAEYMDEHLIHGGDMLHHLEPTSIPSAIFMKKWFRTSKAIVMYLNNGTLQVNFFDDHTKIIISPDGQDYLVTFINSDRNAITYRLLQFRHFGCNDNIAERLRYARSMLENIINIEGETV